MPFYKIAEKIKFPLKHCVINEPKDDKFNELKKHDIHHARVICHSSISHTVRIIFHNAFVELCTIIYNKYKRQV